MLTPELHFTPPSAKKSAQKDKSSGKKIIKRDSGRRGIKPPLYTSNKKAQDFPNRFMDVVKLTDLNPESEIVRRH